MQQRYTFEENGLPDPCKSRSTLSLLWDEICDPNELQKFMDTCFNSHKIIDIDIGETVEPQLNAALSKSHLKDSGTSSLNDEDQSFVFEKEGLVPLLPQKSVKHIVEKFSLCANGYLNTDIEREKWHLVVQELVETEHVYLRSLMEVDDGYLKISNSIFMDDKEVKLIFSNWKDLRTFHSLFLEKLKSINSYEFQSLHRLSECFLGEISQFELLYSEYCTNYTQSIKHLHHMETTSSHTWQSLIQCQTRLGHQLPLSTFLLKPVQRILKYHLLLKELIQCCKLMKHANADDIVESLLKALDNMLKVANRINEKQMEREEILRRSQLLDELYESGTFNCPILGTPYLDGELKVPGCKNSRLVLLCENALVLAKRLGSGKWDIKQVIKCNEMMLFEYIPKQPLEFHVIDTTDNKNKATLQVMNAQEKEIWCKMIKQRIINSYENDSISERAKRILLDNKHNVLSQCQPPVSDDILEKFHISLNRDNEMLDLESCLRKMYDPVSTQSSQNKYKNIKRRNSVGAIKSESKINYRDPSIHQWSARKYFTHDDDIDCRSIMIDVNEESYYSRNDQQLPYEQYLSKSRNKIRLTSDDIKEIFQPMKQMQENSDNSSVLLGEMELASLCSDADLDSVASDNATNNQHKRKSTSMDRTFGMSLYTKANSFTSSMDTNSSTFNNNSNNNSIGISRAKKVLFSSVRETKTTRSNSDWGSLFDGEQKPGLVKRFFKASAKLTKRDKSKSGNCPVENENNNNKTINNENNSTINCEVKRTINKSNSIDYIVQSRGLIQKSNSRKKKAPAAPILPENHQSIDNEEEHIDAELDDSDRPVKPPRQLPQFRIEMFDKRKSISSDRLKNSLNSHLKSMNNNELSSLHLSNSESATPCRVKDLVSIFQSDK